MQQGALLFLACKKNEHGELLPVEVSYRFDDRFEAYEITQIDNVLYAAELGSGSVQGEFIVKVWENIFYWTQPKLTKRVKGIEKSTLLTASEIPDYLATHAKFLEAVTLHHGELLECVTCNKTYLDNGEVCQHIYYCHKHEMWVFPDHKCKCFNRTATEKFNTAYKYSGWFNYLTKVGKTHYKPANRTFSFCMNASISDAEVSFQNKELLPTATLCKGCFREFKRVTK